MIRGGDFYAFWNEETGLWSTDERELFALIDRELDKYAQENKDKYDGYLSIQHMWDSDTAMVKKWHSYCQGDLRDTYHMLDSKLTFANDKTTKEDYVSKKLPYPLKKGTITSYDRLMSVLYSPEERKKLEWAIGSVIDGDSKNLQKFIVLYGAPKTGKSTVLNIMEKLFQGYWAAFDAKALGSANNSFALEAFRTNPLVGIQHDGDLSRIEDNTRLNSLVAHEEMIVNEKFKSAYGARFNTFLFMGTNKPVKITDAKSGIIRRLIDVSPTGDKIPRKEYDILYKNIDFELGAIAYHCREVYRKNKDIYDEYIPMAMLGASNDFYNFVDNYYFVFKKDDGVTLKAAWEMYKTYCDEAKVPYVLPQRIFKEELKNYFREFKDRINADDGSRVRSFYSGFRADRFEVQEPPPDQPIESWLKFNNDQSLFDILCSECPAQYASKKESPLNEWDRVTTALKDLDTTKLHYVRVPENHIVIDFDIPDENGNKCFEKNLEAASKWPETYAELSKSGQGIHLHYIYAGDPSRLSSKYEDHVEVKVFTGKSSLRRKLTKCNDIPVATISSGLPLKGEKKTVNFEAVKSEKGLRSLVMRNLNKEIHPGTKPSVEFIKTILDGAYASGLKYDISDMRTAVFAFAMASTHHAEYCTKLVSQMKFSSEEKIEETKPTIHEKSNRLIFYDVDVFPNLLLVNWKFEGEGQPVVRMINPTPDEIELLLKNRLVGFNCRRYDNHILYARLLGYSNEQLFRLSQSMINDGKGFFREAYNLSYTDVYDFSSKKQSLKKFEIELGIHHQELGYSWDDPVPEELWNKVAEYCDNDVLATEAVFNARKADFTARQILADIAGMTVNDTTNSLTAAIIFGKERRPQNTFNYRNMGDVSQIASGEGYNVFDKEGRPIFPGYLYDHGVSTYRGVEVGEGGRVYAEPGMYYNVALLDIASMHPSSIVAERLFGPSYTDRFQDILSARIAIKHGDLDHARGMLGGALAPYLTDPSIAKDLAQALKIVINSVYGLTAANFDNPFRDIRNVDNIVAKRGALFMVNLQNEVQEKGFTVAHIKTDSIKIPNATPEIIQFVMDYGKKYGYNFEHEATYEKMCLVNDAVYIAKEKDGEWTATGTQFQVPYVFKKLFSHEEIAFDDMCETKAVSTALYLQFDQEAIDILSKDVTPDELERMKQIPMFVGRIGRFCPMKPGTGGGQLLRMSKDKDGNVKYGAVTGTKGYFWLESEVVRTLHKEKDINEDYYISLVDDAKATISQYGDFEKFVSDDKEKEWDFMNLPEGPDEIPLEI